MGSNHRRTKWKHTIQKPLCCLSFPKFFKLCMFQMIPARDSFGFDHRFHFIPVTDHHFQGAMIQSMLLLQLTDTRLYRCSFLHPPPDTYGSFASSALINYKLTLPTRISLNTWQYITLYVSCEVRILPDRLECFLRWKRF